MRADPRRPREPDRKALRLPVMGAVVPARTHTERAGTGVSEITCCTRRQGCPLPPDVRCASLIELRPVAHMCDGRCRQWGGRLRDVIDTVAKGHLHDHLRWVHEALIWKLEGLSEY